MKVKLYIIYQGTEILKSMEDEEPRNIMKKKEKQQLKREAFIDSLSNLLSISNIVAFTSVMQGSNPHGHRILKLRTVDSRRLLNGAIVYRSNYTNCRAPFLLMTFTHPVMVL